MAPRRITVLGSTGSIGTQTLEVAESLGIGISALAAGSNSGLLIDQALRFRPQVVAIADPNAVPALKKALAGKNIKVLEGDAGVTEAACVSADMVVSAIVGAAGLKPTAAAIAQGRDIALANKETLVTAGEYITRLCEKNSVRLFPVDSEHSAIYQCLEGQSRKALKRIWLTASGGPFFGYGRDRLAAVTPQEALRHPNWSMGSKITIDSATLMNKGFEMIEAAWLFGVGLSDITVAVHRQSVIHSMVEFEDGSVIAQLGSPDMRLPIQYALTWPERKPCTARPLDVFSCGPLTFERPDEDTFRCLAACRSAAAAGGLAPAALNAANEVAVAEFLAGNIGFLQIGEVAENAVKNAPAAGGYSIQDVIETDRQARAEALRFIRQINRTEIL